MKFTKLGGLPVGSILDKLVIGLVKDYGGSMNVATAGNEGGVEVSRNGFNVSFGEAVEAHLPSGGLVP